MIFVYLLGREVDPVLGHAVLAAEVAPLRQRDPQVVVVPPEGVAQEVGQILQALKELLRFASVRSGPLLISSNIHIRVFTLYKP